MNFGGLTAKQYLLLSQFAYVKVTEDPVDARDYYGKTLGYIIDQILSTPTTAELGADNISKEGVIALEELIIPGNACLSIGDYKRLFQEIKDDPVLSSLTLKAYRNDDGDGKGGFAGYAFENSAGDTFFSIAGTEGIAAEMADLAAQGIDLGNPLLKSEDWLNNYYWGIMDSSFQYVPTVEFVEQNLGSSNNYITGHSQGGANAVYACGEVPGLTGMVFDAPGISQLLSPLQKMNVEQSGVINYINQNDFVGPMFWHAEKTVFVRSQPVYKRDDNGRIILENGVPATIEGLEVGHYTQAILFDTNGNVVEAQRSAISITSEILFQTVYERLQYKFGKSFYGGGSTDVLYGGFFDDVIYGGQGDDTINGSAGKDQISGQEGNDTIYGGQGADNLHGGQGDDTIYGEDESDTIDGYDGDDKLFGGTSSDLIIGGLGNDTIKGDAGRDIIYGDEGEDNIDGGEYADTIYGGADDDTIHGGTGNDLIYGGTGNDLIDGDEGADKIHGSYGDDGLYGGDGADDIYGGHGNDVIMGDFGNDMLYGEDGNDELYGGIGSDVLVGGLGDDILDGGSGNDYLEGNSGSDTYYFGYNRGKDFIYDVNNTDVNGLDTYVDKVVLSMLPDDVILKRYRDNLVVCLKDSTDDVLTVINYFKSDYEKIERFEFTDGTIWHVADILDKNPSVIGDAEAETIYGGCTYEEIIRGNIDQRAATELY
ncbi:MAG: calcium-binding protein, partial [Bacillota bacterium]